MLEQQPMVSVSLCHWPPEALMSKAHHAGKAREFSPFHLAIPDAIPWLHTFPTELTTVTSAIPDYLKVQPKCKPGVCDSALLHAALLQSSSLNHFAKPRVCWKTEQPLYFDIPAIWIALTGWREESCGNGEVPEWAEADLGKLSACLCNRWEMIFQNAVFVRKCLCVETNQAYCIFSLRRDLKQNSNIDELMQFLLPQNFNLQERCLKSKHWHDFNIIFKEKPLVVLPFKQ